MPAGHLTGQRAKIREIMIHEARPLSVAEVTMYLGMSGWEWTSFDPNDSVKTSLKKAPDMVRIAHNRWILESFDYMQSVITAARPKMRPTAKKYRWDQVEAEQLEASRVKMREQDKARREALRAAYI